MDGARFVCGPEVAPVPVCLAVQLSDPGQLLKTEHASAILDAHRALMLDAVAAAGTVLSAADIAPDPPDDTFDGVPAPHAVMRPFVATFADAGDALLAAVAIQQGARERIAGDEAAQLDATRLQSAISLFEASDASYTAGLRRRRCGAVMGGQIICDAATFKALTTVPHRKPWLRRLIPALRRAGEPPPPPPGAWTDWQPAPHDGGRASGAMECLYDDRLSLTNAPFERAFAAEVRDWIRPRRQRRDAERRGQRPSAADLRWPERPDVRNQLVGLALSGGGMRSAVFSLGVTQALARHGFLEDVDYISTVSGGGYTGASLCALWAEPLPYDGLPRLGCRADNFPYAYPAPPLSADCARGELRPVHGNESPALQHVRQHARFLVGPEGPARTALLAGTVVLTAATLWALYLLPPLAFIGLLGVAFRELLAGVGWWQRLAFIIVSASFALTLTLLVIEAATSGAHRPWIRAAADGLLWLASAGTLLVVFGVVTDARAFTPMWHGWRAWFALSPLFLFTAGTAIATALGQQSKRWLRAPAMAAATALSRLSLILAAVLSLVLAIWGLDRLVDAETRKWVIAQVTAVTGAVATVTGVSLWKLLGQERAKAALWAAATAVGGYLLLAGGIVSGSWGLWQAEHHNAGMLLAIGLPATAGLLVVPVLWRSGGRAWLNWSSLHRLYAAMIENTWVIAARERDVLAMPALPRWSRVWTRHDITMSTLRAADATPSEDGAGPSSPSPSSPYPLFCTALNLPGSTGPKMLDRKSDSFVIAPVASGSALTRWQPTHKLGDIDTMPLARVAAISGAAVSPNMGEATTRTRSIITTLLNVRLGHWVKNPRTTPRIAPLRLLFSIPLVLYWKEMFGLASRDDGDVYLSDGGHFENLGLYELLRRRCKYIIAVTADTGRRDEPFDLSNLGKALRLARVDFGAEVALGPLAPLMHDPKTGTVRSFFAAGEITYPTSAPDGQAPLNERGVLIVVKTGIVEDALSADVLNYWKDEHTAFPYDQLTSERFDQPQFESYRQLGYLAGRAMCKPADTARTTRDRFDAVRKDYDERFGVRQPEAPAVSRGDGDLEAELLARTSIL